MMYADFLSEKFLLKWIVLHDKNLNRKMSQFQNKSFRLDKLDCPIEYQM